MTRHNMFTSVLLMASVTIICIVVMVVLSNNIWVTLVGIVGSTILTVTAIVGLLRFSCKYAAMIATIDKQLQQLKDSRGWP